MPKKEKKAYVIKFPTVVFYKESGFKPKDSLQLFQNGKLLCILDNAKITEETVQEYPGVTARVKAARK